MRKLAYLFVLLLSLTLLAGCNHSKKTVTKFSSDDETESTTTVTTIDNGEKVEQEPIEIPVTDDTDSDDASEAVEKKPIDTVAFSVTTPKENVVRSDKGYHLIQGTTPESTAKIVINGYTLNKYKEGKTNWSYIAAASLGTLKRGENRYTVSAFDDDGKKLGSKSFSIVYQGIDNGTLISTGSNTLPMTLALSVMISIALFWFRKPLFAQSENR